MTPALKGITMKRARIAAAGLTATAAAVALVATLTPMGANAVNPETAAAAATKCTGAAWNKTLAYNGGDVVTYEGHSYTAKWWSYSDVPGAKGGADVWTDGGACSGTPTENPTEEPTNEPTDEPTDVPSSEPTATQEPTDGSSTDPTDPGEEPTDEPTDEPPTSLLRSPRVTRRSSVTTPSGARTTATSR